MNNNDANTNEDVAPQRKTGVGWIVIAVVMILLVICALVMQIIVQPIQSAQIWRSSNLCDKIDDISKPMASANMFNMAAWLCAWFSPLHFGLALKAVVEQGKVLKMLQTPS